MGTPATGSDAAEKTVAHSGFTLTRDYPVPVGSVWSAFADEDQKREWFGGGAVWTPGEWQHDFRVGGRDVAEGTFHGGTVSRYVARYTDIVENVRIITSYDMWLDGAHISTSVASFEFEGIATGTRFTHTEHGIHLDGLDDGEGRREGTEGLLTALGELLTR
ncbi:SRPBCC domain-containing protein [Gordonia soli]|uniref:Activator of Hsp90 ATPase homologue 1/2-like C-terminal domain-containing protein n=1 Tax=Gordonia soli NBRC 108243 TaxID=1223545 RepID=M0QQK2_9ACTN|nr:SRPBCC domain-containing protein [Gordonia soli]GAC69727.1 hypothetical protein GS4_27_00050 [Gordonia soli NBRC 108243]